MLAPLRGLVPSTLPHGAGARPHPRRVTGESRPGLPSSDDAVPGCRRRHLQLRGGGEVVDRLDNGVGVDNEEQGMPVAICHDPLGSWADTWAGLRHLD